MGEILGLTISDFPFHRFKPHYEVGVIQGNQARGWTDNPELNDSKNWRPEMQQLWGDDQGWSAGIKLQDSQIDQFRKVRAALEKFRPDAIAFVFRDLGETWGPANDPANPRPKYWLHLHDDKELPLYTLFGNRENYFEEDPDKRETIKFHREATQLLIDALKKGAPVAPDVATEVKSPNGMGHNFLAGVVHTDWDKREYATPVIAIGVDPFGFGRTRNNEGLSPWDKNAEPPLTAKQAFGVGQTLAKAIKASPYRIALIADCDWSHANDHARTDFIIHPDVHEDRKRFEEWRKGEFTQWGDNWTFEQMEEHAQWQMLCTIVLAGAMTEVGAKIEYTHFQEDTWIFNDGMVTTIFDAK
jgi:hypothetical protein